MRATAATDVAAGTHADRVHSPTDSDDMALSKRQRLTRFLEFLVIGVVMGLIEDLLAVALATDATIDWKVVLIVLAVAVPFAIVSELVVDHPRFWEVLMPRSWFPNHWVKRHHDYGPE